MAKQIWVLLAHVLAVCLMRPSHYLNQHWAEGNFTKTLLDIIYVKVFENYIFENKSISPRQYAITGMNVDLSSLKWIRYKFQKWLESNRFKPAGVGTLVIRGNYINTVATADALATWGAWHQQPWYWLYRINSLSSTVEDLKYQCPSAGRRNDRKCKYFRKFIENQLNDFTNPTMHLFHIPQCAIQNRNVYISVLNGALWDRCILRFVMRSVQNTDTHLCFPGLREFEMTWVPRQLQDGGRLFINRHGFASLQCWEINMMTLWRRNIFRITGALSESIACGFSSQKASNATLCCFLWCLPEHTDKQTVGLSVIWDAITPMWHHCNDTVEYLSSVEHNLFDWCDKTWIV